jgi:dATP pyrophosphohydrolase
MSKIVSKYIECYVYLETAGVNKYLLLKRSHDKHPYPGIWQIVTGRIEENEAAYDTALREVKEETGLKIKKLYVLPKAGSFYTAHTDSLHLIPLFLAYSDGCAVMISSEHTEYEWLSYKEARERIHWYNQKENLDMIEEMLCNPLLKGTFVEIKID